MDLRWSLALDEPRKARSRIGVKARFRFTERVRPEPTRTAQFQSFRLLQVSSMFIDADRHDVNALRYRAAKGKVKLFYRRDQADSLLPTTPFALQRRTPILDSLHTDDRGRPNGDTPSYRLRIRRAPGPVSGPLTPRAYFSRTTNLNEDNLGLWIHRRPLEVIPRGARGTIDFTVTATPHPLPIP